MSQDNRGTSAPLWKRELFIRANKEVWWKELIQLASQLMGTPISWISVGDLNLSEIKAWEGVEAEDLDRLQTFAELVLHTSGPVCIPDLTQDPRFAAHPLVAGVPAVRSWIGLPVCTPLAEKPIGVLSVMDTCPRDFSTQHCHSLESLIRLALPQIMSLTDSPRTTAAVNDAAAEPPIADSTAQIEGKLPQNDDLLRMASRVGRLGGWVVELPDFHLIWSDEVCAIHEAPPGFHISVDESIELYAPEYQPVIRDAFYACVEQGTPFDEELQIITLKGRRVWVRAMGEAVRNEHGHVVRVQGAFQEITKYKKIETQLRHRDSLLRIAGKVANIAGWVVKLPTRRVLISPELYELLAYPPAQALTVDDALAFFTMPSRQKVSEALDHCLSTATPFDVEAEIFAQDGDLRWVRVQGQADQDDLGTIKGARGAVQDITEQKRTEELVYQSQQQFRQLADAMPLIVWTANPDGMVDYANQTYVDYAGVTPDELPGDAWLRTLHPEDVEPCLTAWSESVRLGKPYEIEFRIHGQLDGGYRWHLVRAIPIYDENGTLVKWYGSGVDIHDTKLAEEKARRLAHRLSTTLESITDAFFTLDLDWNFTYVNQEAERLLQRSREELLGRCVWAEFPEAVNSTFYHQYHRALAEGVTTAFEEYYPPLQTWFNVRAFPSAEGLAVYFHDVTMQRAAQEALSISEERFKLVARATNDAIWDWNLETQQLWWNEGLEVLFGHSPDELEPDIRSWTKHIHPEDQEWVVKSIEDAIQNPGTNWQAEYRFICADGRTAYVLDRGFVIRNAAGKAIRMVGGMTNLTEHKQNEQRLQEQAALLDKASDAILVRDLEHRITFWNKSAERIYGWQAHEVLQRSAVELLHANPAEFYQATAHVLEHGEWVGELVHTGRDGRQILVEGHWSLVRNQDGTPQAILAINTDITERKRLETQFLRAQRLESIGTLAGGIAHDLNNVLAPILLSIPLLKRNAQSERDLRRVEMLEESANRGAEMVRQVLTFARGADGQRIPLEMDHIVRDVTKLLSDTLGKHITIKMSIPEKIWSVVGDPTQIHQVLVNLCINARDAMPMGGDLFISVENLYLDQHAIELNTNMKPGPYICLKVADTGIGIPASLLDRIFDPFFTTKETGKGTGLGLSTVQGIVRSHQGAIHVYSEEGQGATFKVYLPAQHAELTMSARVYENVLPRGQGETILVVDDEQVVRNITQQVLESFGYRVLLATNGAEALSVYRQQHTEIDLVLTDVMMAELDGENLMQAILSINPAARLVAATGMAASGVMTKLGEAGIRILIKPYTTELLLRTLDQVLRLA